MIKRIFLVLCGLLLVLSIRPAYLIGVSLGIWQPLTRPAGVTKRARYVDAFTSEAWIDCSVDQTRNVNHCRAWDVKGNLIASGNYRIDGENRAATTSELYPSEVDEYPRNPNLSWIYLFGDHGQLRGKTLVPVNEAGQPLERFEVHIENELPRAR